MSDDDKREQARLDFNDAVANGQVHPAVANYLAALDSDLRGANDNHEALRQDLARREREEREAREDQGDGTEPESTPDTQTDKPAETVKPNPAAVAATKAGGNRR
jgi:hypothetical protein